MIDSPTIVAGNWKMNTDLEKGVFLARLVAARDSEAPGVQMVLCPPFTHLSDVRRALYGSDVAVGAQNIYTELSGAYTGEISPLNLHGLCDYVIIGHSERRRVFGESNDLVARKVACALKYKLIPILCVGETLAEREDGSAAEVVREQVVSAISPPNPDATDYDESDLHEIDSMDALNLVIAYEPVWAIGTGLAATPEIAYEMMNGVISSALEETLGPEAAEVRPLLYGGSVNPGNAATFAAVPGISGALVGGASLDADSFLAVAAAFADLGS